VISAGAFLMMAPRKPETIAYPPPPIYVPPVGTTAGPDGVAGAIGGLAQTGGSSEWDSAVKPIMTRAYDLNGSGAIDNAPEVQAIPCATWLALEAGVKQSWDYGLRTIYGFEAGYTWVGDAIGISEAARVPGDATLMACLTGTPTTPPATASGPVAGRIRGLVEDGGGSAWDDTVALIMVGAFDGNKSGQIDTTSELGAIPCDVWKAMDDGVHMKWDYGLRTIYGFDGVGYLGNELGFGDSMMGPGQQAMIGCGLPE